MRLIRSGSPMFSDTVAEGSKDPYGDWKTICMSRRTRRSFFAGSSARETPSKVTLPEVGSIRCSAIRARVNAARAIQTARFGPEGPACNAQMDPGELQEFCRLDEACQKLIQGAYESLGLTARSYDRVLRVARTIADLDGAGDIELPHLAEALQYRPPEYLRR